MPLAKPLFLLLFLLLPTLAGAGDRGQLLSFADALFTEGDYYRAVTEYKRFLHLFPEDGDAPRAALRIAEGYLAGERWAEAEQALNSLTQAYPDTPQAARAALLYAETPYRRGDFAVARHRYRRLSEEAGDPRTREEARYRLAWTLIEEDRYDQAREHLLQLNRDAAGNLAGEMERMERLPRKSPALAGGLSAVLPGAGQLYAGRPRDAALALLLNAAFLWGTLEAFNDGNAVVGGILLFFEAGWYSGNIYNAVNNAHKHNRDVREEERKKLRTRHGLTLGLHDGTPLLGMQVRF